MMFDQFLGEVVRIEPCSCLLSCCKFAKEDERIFHTTQSSLKNMVNEGRRMSKAGTDLVELHPVKRVIEVSGKIDFFRSVRSAQHTAGRVPHVRIVCVCRRPSCEEYSQAIGKLFYDHRLYRCKRKLRCKSVVEN